MLVKKGSEIMVRNFEEILEDEDNITEVIGTFIGYTSWFNQEFISEFVDWIGNDGQDNYEGVLDYSEKMYKDMLRKAEEIMILLEGLMDLWATD